MSFKKIICPIDFSPGSQQAMSTAARLATRLDAELELVHAVYVTLMVMGGVPPISPELVQQQMDDAARDLESAARDARSRGVKRVTTKLVSGQPWQRIVELAEVDTGELMVIGTHGRSGVARVLLGSVAEKVVRHAPCSVLVVHPHDDAKPFLRVLCPLDASDAADGTASRAAELVEPGGVLALLHVVELWSSYFEAPQAIELVDELRARAAGTLDAHADRLRATTTMPVTTRVLAGNPGAETLLLLDKEPFDLVVMGSHGRTGIKRLVLGSVAEKIVRHAPCPVLVVRARS